MVTKTKMTNVVKNTRFNKSKVHLTPKYFYTNIKLCTYFKNISPLFAVFDFFTGFKSYEKLSTIRRTAESEGA